MAPRARPSSAACPPCAWHPLRSPPLVRTPVPPALPACAQKGVRAWWGTQTEGEEVRPRWRGPPRTGRGDTVPCASPACVQRGRGAGGRGGRGEARRGAPGDGGGIGRAEG